jgi:hypothetical protein
MSVVAPNEFPSYRVSQVRTRRWVSRAPAPHLPAAGASPRRRQLAARPQLHCLQVAQQALGVVGYLQPCFPALEAEGAGERAAVAGPESAASAGELGKAAGAAARQPRRAGAQQAALDKYMLRRLVCDELPHVLTTCKCEQVALALAQCAAYMSLLRRSDPCLYHPCRAPRSASTRSARQGRHTLTSSSARAVAARASTCLPPTPSFSTTPIGSRELMNRQWCTCAHGHRRACGARAQWCERTADRQGTGSGAASLARDRLHACHGRAINQRPDFTLESVTRSASVLGRLARTALASRTT